MDHWLLGYKRSELDAAQERYDLRFPPDLIDLLLEKRPARGYDWRTDDQAIRSALAHPLDGLLFDLENNGLWWPEWGKRPDSISARATVLTEVVSAAPKLVPILSHRYIPSEPHQAGNPVFSIMQADAIYYGADLDDYFQREFFPEPFPQTPIREDVRHIRFWSDIVIRNPLGSWEE